jgi:hypothetical protein
VLALVVAIIAIFMPEKIRKKENEIESIERCLYCFYYPAVDYIEGYSIKGMKRNDEDIEHIALYRRLAEEETRKAFEKYRKGNYKKDDGKDILPKLISDINKYEKKLKDLQ